MSGRQIHLILIPLKTYGASSTKLHFVLFFLDIWNKWVLNFILAEKGNQKVLSDPSKNEPFLFPAISCARKVINSPCLLRDKTLKCRISRSESVLAWLDNSKHSTLFGNFSLVVNNLKISTKQNERQMYKCHEP